MKRFTMAVALMCVLSAPIFAGDMPTTEPIPAPPATSSSLLVTVVLTIISLR